MRKNKILPAALAAGAALLLGLAGAGFYLASNKTR